MHRYLVALAICACGSPPHTEPAAPPVPVHVPSDSAPATPPVAKKDGPPLAAVRPVKDTYHGVTVEDPYRWLEEDTPEVKAWSDAQNTYARAVLDKLPEKQQLADELAKILNAPVTAYSDFKVGGTKLFARRKQPDNEQPVLIVMTDPDHATAAKVVLDPISADHPRRSFDWYKPSPDGSKVAIAESDGGSEVADVHIVDVAGKELEVVPNVQRPTGGGDVTWTPDGKGLYYTRYPMPGEPHEADKDGWLQVYFHKLGTATAKDTYELGKDLPKNAEILLASDSRGRVLASVQLGDGGRFRHYVKDAKGWRQLDDWDDRIAAVAFGSTPDLWLISRKDAPRGKLMRLAANAKTAQEAAVVVPEGKDAMITSFSDDEGVTVVGDHVFVRYQLGGPSELRSFYLTGKPDKGPVGPPVSTASKPLVWRGDVLVEFASYVTPSTWERFSPKSGKSVALPDFTPAYPVDFSTIEARREVATSKDGTAVPLNILWPKGAPQDGTVACVVTGYGGFSISEEPHEFLAWAPMLARGMCIVDVNLRGGGEYGEDWHRHGMLLEKQHVFDDFAAALDYLVAKHYTSRHKLGIIGGSNGGLLVGVMMTERPELFGAVVCEAPLLDMKRYHKLLAGASWMEEYGNPELAEEWAAIAKYSPYQNVHKDTKYPPVLFTTSTRDDRVHPGHARKMAARMIEQGHDVMFYENIEGGHAGAADAEQAALMTTLAYSFLWKQLGLTPS
ncbi:MAG TPA: prolyl oligopeptidase family serine peptidase [Kofleriaceae bacterium]|nr:prolyl oligopeptidase family serine peptidase [Kofleriaceae bacterium]